MKSLKCFACDKKLNPNPNVACTSDGQYCYVGQYCYLNIKQSGEKGWQPPMGGPRLFIIPKGLSQQQLSDIHSNIHSNIHSKAV